MVGKVFAMPPANAQIVQDNVGILPTGLEGRERPKALQTKVSAAVAAGTSGAEFIRIRNAGALSAPHSRARRGASTGFLAAQLRRIFLETSRALLLLPPSLVRSGALRSDIYSSASANVRRTAWAAA
jgi:hypothetical protein